MNPVQHDHFFGTHRSHATMRAITLPHAIPAPTPGAPLSVVVSIATPAKQAPTMMAPGPQLGFNQAG